MDLSLTETQQLLRQGVRDFIARDLPRQDIIELRRGRPGYSEAVWNTVSDVGWLGMLTPEAYGGSGSNLMDVAVVFEALGEGPVPGPLFSSGVLVPLIIGEAGTEEQCQRYLPSLARGQMIATLALTEPEWSWSLEAIGMVAVATVNGAFRLNGTKLFVYDAETADVLLVAARLETELALFVVPRSTPGVSVRPLSGFLTSECEVRFDNVELPADARLGNGEVDSAAALEHVLGRATPILCAYMVGCAHSAYELSLAYTRERRQFGQPIGRFQHVQGHMIQLVNYLDAARWTTYDAIWKLDNVKAGADVAVHLAKICASEGCVQATNYAHEVHAGVGTMEDYGLTLFTRLSRSLYHALGDPRWHRRRLGRLLAVSGPA